MKLPKPLYDRIKALQKRHSAMGDWICATEPSTDRPKPRFIQVAELEEDDETLSLAMMLLHDIVDIHDKEEQA